MAKGSKGVDQIHIQPDELPTVYDGIESDWQNMDFTPYLQEQFGELENMHIRFNVMEVDPSGQPWEELSPHTIERKGHSKKLVEHGRLLASLSSEASGSVRRVSNEGLTYGTSVEYGSLQQYGGPGSTTGIIPPRPFVGLTLEYIDKFVNGLADYVVEQMKKSATKT